MVALDPGSGTVVLGSREECHARSMAVRELNLIGRRVEDARRELERFLDAAILARLPDVRIVHGYGTGALRELLVCGGAFGLSAYHLVNHRLSRDTMTCKQRRP